MILNLSCLVDVGALCNYPFSMGNLPISIQAVTALVSLVLATVLVMIFRKVTPLLRRSEWFDSGKTVEGAPRAVFPIFTILVLWASFIFLLPMTLGYREEIASSTTILERLIVTAKILFAPFVFLVVLSYGAKRGFLQWVRDLKWPNNDPED